MNLTWFANIIEEQISRCRDILIVKGAEYATSDRLHNFRQAATLQGIDTSQALAGMMAKHTISVYDLITNGDFSNLDIWNEKITDHINYLLLLRAVVEEKHQIQPQQLTLDIEEN